MTILRQMLPAASTLASTLALAMFALVSSITPGPNNIMLMNSGTNFGFTRTLPHLLGVTLGFVFMIVCVGAGLIQIFVIIPALHLVLKVVSVAYLLWLSWKIATASPPSAAETKSDSKPLTFVQAALFQWVNPKAWTMALGAVSAYVPIGQPVAGLASVAGIFGLVNLPACAVWTGLGVQLRRIMDQPTKLRAFNIGAALLLVASLYPVIFDGH